MSSYWKSKVGSLPAVICLAFAAILTACGGGGGSAGDPVLGGGAGSAAVSELSIVLDKTSLPNDGSQAMTATVTALDAGRVAVKNVAVSFSVDNGGVVKPAGTTTDDKGELKAAVEIGSDKTNRTITVTAKAGSITKTASFSVVDSTVTVPKANSLTMVLDKVTVGNSGSDTVTATVTAVGTGGNVVTGIPVTFTVDNNATIAPSGTQTNASGEVTAKIKIGSDKSNRLITVTARSDTLEYSASFQVTGAKLTGTPLPALPPAGSTGNSVEYRLFDVNQIAMPGVAITVSAPGLPNASGTTNSSGAYVYTYTAPTTPGPIDITARAGGATSVQTVTVPSGTSTVPAVTTTVSSASVSSSPDVVSVNETDTANRTEIRALFFAAGNVPVKNIRVRFDLNGDTSIPGTLSSGTSLVYSDSVGTAVTSYTPGKVPSPTNGVAIRACWDYDDFAVGTCPNQALTSLTVVSTPISITIGTSELIEESTSRLNYIKRFALQVVDAAGNPKADVQITPTVDLLAYSKGRYVWDSVSSSWLPGVDRIDTALFTRPGPSDSLPYCQNEDGLGDPTKRNGLIDTGEDINGNGQLDPRKSDVSITMVGSTKTDANGNAVLKIEYPKSVASWVAFRIKASAVGVLSPPAIYDGVLPYVGTAVKSETVAPAFVTSPYGTRAYLNDVNGPSCRDPR